MVCKQYHALRFCRRFLRMNVMQRARVVCRYRYCDNCLARSHDLRACSSQDTCRKCGSYHHTLLHPTNRRNKDLRSRINIQRTRRGTTNRPNNNSSNRRNVQPSSTDISPTTTRQIPAVPDQQIISEAIRSLAQVLCV